MCKHIRLSLYEVTEYVVVAIFAWVTQAEYQSTTRSKDNPKGCQLEVEAWWAPETSSLQS